ncbi:hypothetical protein SAMN05192576_1793 [Nocardioides szechwanensis]|uniref:Uncharacterized protein n=2 Tax=Nocardioides szechwanensis TaxID=1005944 RepID=A0A1G9ZNG9_9ACTN|nr:DUF6629 family protein [Nocardioides szechwanensis]SDN22868.1 hypothetical protein SAMN05192576_1793 [Nocardioides szechwanensis]
MCFSMEADLVAGAVLLPIGVLSLSHVREPREVPLAALPLLLGVHQLVEAVVWAGVDGSVSSDLAHLAALVYVVIALPLLPTLFPLAVWLIETSSRRRLVVPFLAVGVVVSAYMGLRLWQNGLDVVAHDFGLEYRVGLGFQELWTGAYVVATMGACVVSSYRTVVAFGVLNLIGLTIVGLAYAQAFASLWCVYAALVSVLILVHMVWRNPRHQPQASLAQL